MKVLFTVLLIASSVILNARSIDSIPPVKIMTLGVFHFNYPNLDFHKTAEKDQISVLDEPWQSEILSLCKAIEEFNPTMVAVEFLPEYQQRIDSLFGLYKKGSWVLGKNEVYQLGFRIGKNLDLDKIYCIDDMGRHYSNISSIFSDSVRLRNFEDYYLSNPDSAWQMKYPTGKITGIIDALIDANHPEFIREGLSSYLLHPFKYEETPGDFTGVDFETGRWYNRNLRIFRNIQRLPYHSQDRILMIIGSGHLNLLNLFFDISKEFELVSPLDYLMKAKKYQSGNL